MKETFNNKKKNKKKKGKGEKQQTFKEGKDYYFSFVKTCRLKRVLLKDFKNAIKKIRDNKPPSILVQLFKKGNMHVKPSDQGRAFIIDYLIRKKLVKQQEPEKIDLTFDDDVTPPSSVPVRRERETPEPLPASKRARVDEEYAKHACSEPVIGYMRHVLMPYASLLMRRQLTAKGVRLKDLLSTQVCITLMYHPPTCMYHPPHYVSPACITQRITSMYHPTYH